LQSTRSKLLSGNGRRFPSGLELDALSEPAARGRKIRLRLRDHPLRAVHADEFPLRQTPRELDDDLSGSRADVERAAAFASFQKPQRMFNQSVVNRVEMRLTGGRGIGLDLARIVHHLGLGNARHVEERHRENSSARGELLRSELERRMEFPQPDPERAAIRRRG